MAWLTLTDALDALRQRLQAYEGFSPAQRVAIVDIMYRWQQELETQKRVPDERRKCAVCGNTVAPAYVVDSKKRPVHIICLSCWRREEQRERLAEERELDADWDGLLNNALLFEDEQ